MMTINAKTRLNQVKSALLNYIVQNNLKRNDQMPAEASIAKELGVSRNTLREAYISLENEGIIVRRHGIGTFIAQTPMIHDSLNDFSPFAKIIQDGGYTPNHKTLSMLVGEAPEEVCDVFSIPSDQVVRCIHRVVLADDQPVIYVADYVSPSVEEEDLDWNAFDGNMVQFLTERLSISLHQIQSSIRAAIVNQEIGSYLDLPEGAPVLSVRSTIYAIDNKPVNYSIIAFNSDIVEMNTVRVIRPT